MNQVDSGVECISKALCGERFHSLLGRGKGKRVKFLPDHILVADLTASMPAAFGTVSPVVCWQSHAYMQPYTNQGWSQINLERSKNQRCSELLPDKHIQA